MSHKDVFEKFDKFKNDIESILNKIKVAQAEVKDSLGKESKTLLLKNIEDIQNSIMEFKQQFISNIDNSIKHIKDNAIFTNIEDLKHLQKKISSLKKNKTSDIE